jgi:hypothetical protein
VDLYDEPPPPMVTTRPETKRNTAVKTKADEDEDY